MVLVLLTHEGHVTFVGAMLGGRIIDINVDGFFECKSRCLSVTVNGFLLSDFVNSEFRSLYDIYDYLKLRQ